MTMASTHLQHDQAPDLADEADVIATLERALAQATRDACSGIMLIIRDHNGEHLCASAGWYARNRESSLRPALDGISQLCRPAEEVHAPEPAPRPTTVVLH